MAVNGIPCIISAGADNVVNSQESSMQFCEVWSVVSVSLGVVAHFGSELQHFGQCLNVEPELTMFLGSVSMESFLALVPWSETVVLFLLPFSRSVPLAAQGVYLQSSISHCRVRNSCFHQLGEVGRNSELRRPKW